MAKQVWISEEDAAKEMGYEDRVYFRNLVKKGTLAISYRTNPSGRVYQYDFKAIERIKNANAFIIQS